MLLLISAVLLLGVPGLRDVWDMQWETRRRWLPTAPEIDAVLRRHPGDPQLLFAAALQAGREADRLHSPYLERKPSAEELRQARARAAATRQAALNAADNWPAPWFYLACSGIGVETLPYASPQEEADPAWRPVPETPEKRAEVHEAVRLLTRAATLDPGNARVRYLLAILHFAEWDDRAAWRELAAAEQASQWDDYQKDTALALRRLYIQVPSVRPWASMLAGTESDRLFAGSPLRTLGRLLARQAEIKRKAGQHAAALKLYRSVLLLGYRLRHDARDGIDALVGCAITPMAYGPFLSPEERERFSRDRSDGWLTRQHRAEAQAFARYAAAHGEAALGQFAVREAEAAADFKDRFRVAIRRQAEGPLALLNSLLGTAFPLLPYQLAAVAGWLAIWGAIVGLACLRRRRPVAAPLRAWPQVVLLLVLVAANLALAAWYRTGESSVNAEGERQPCPAWGWVALSGAGTGLLWGIGMALTARAAARRLRREGTPDGTPSTAATAALYALPIFSVAVLYGVVLLLLVYGYCQYQGHVAMQEALVGELHYLGIVPR